MKTENNLELIIRARVKRIVADYEGSDPSHLLGLIKTEVERLIKENENGK